MKYCLFAALALGAAATAVAGTATFGWEGSETILGSYGDVLAEVSTDQAYSGTQSLYIEEQASSGTSQAYVGWIVGLTDGDEVTASFMCYDDTPSGSPRGRIWAHWNDDPNDINGYSGSAGGNSTYSSGIGWEELAYTWTVDEGHTGIVIEARIYSDPGDWVYIDDLEITAPDGATIYTPQQQDLDSETWGAIKGSAL